MVDDTTGKQATSLDMLPSQIENNNLIKKITLHWQCDRFLYDLLSTLVEHPIHKDRCLNNFRNQLNRVHEIVKFRTAIPITSIFVSLLTLFSSCSVLLLLSLFSLFLRSLFHASLLVSRFVTLNTLFSIKFAWCLNFQFKSFSFVKFNQ